MTRFRINDIETLLADLGVLPPNKHQDYAVKALIMYKDATPSVMHVYEVVAKTCETTPKAVERGIRVAHLKAIKCHNKDLLTRIFGQNTVDLQHITNREFLASIARYLRRLNDE